MISLNYTEGFKPDKMLQEMSLKLPSTVMRKNWEALPVP